MYRIRYTESKLERRTAERTVVRFYSAIMCATTEQTIADKEKTLRSPED